MRTLLYAAIAAWLWPVSVAAQDVNVTVRLRPVETHQVCFEEATINGPRCQTVAGPPVTDVDRWEALSQSERDRLERAAIAEARRADRRRANRLRASRLAECRRLPVRDRRACVESVPPANNQPAHRTGPPTITGPCRPNEPNCVDPPMPKTQNLTGAEAATVVTAPNPQPSPSRSNSTPSQPNSR